MGFLPKLESRDRNQIADTYRAATVRSYVGTLDTKGRSLLPSSIEFLKGENYEQKNDLQD